MSMSWAVCQLALKEQVFSFSREKVANWYLTLSASMIGG